MSLSSHHSDKVRMITAVQWMTMLTECTVYVADDEDGLDVVDDVGVEDSGGKCK